MSRKLQEPTNSITFRLPVSVIEQLDKICDMYGLTRRDFFYNAITTEYDKLQGNPKLQDIIFQMKELSLKMKELAPLSSDGLGSDTGDDSGLKV